MWNVPLAEYHVQLKLTPIMRDLAYFRQNLVAVAMCLRTLKSEMFSSDWPTIKTPIITYKYITFSLSLSRINALLAILVPKLVAMVTALCPLCMGVSKTNSPVARTLSQNQTFMDMSHATEVMAIFVISLLILAKLWLPWQRALDPWKQKCLLSIG